MSFEQRANIKFCFKIGKTFTETFQLMKQVYGDDCLSRSRVHKWFQRLILKILDTIDVILPIFFIDKLSAVIDSIIGFVE